MLKLLLKRSFGSLTLAQFFGALNDNALKQIFLLLAVQTVMTGGSEAGYEIQATAMAVFALPFLIFSSFAGQLADRISKRTVIVLTKVAEILIVLLGGYGIAVESLPLIVIALFLLAVQSSFFSPAKYGILPEILSREQLSPGNGIIQTTTYIAILAGTALAGFLLHLFPQDRWLIGAILGAFSLVGAVASLLIRKVPAADPERTLLRLPMGSFLDTLAGIVRDRYLFLSMIGFAYVWFAGSLLMLNLNVYGMVEMELPEHLTSLLLVFLAMGIGAGCLLAGRWSKRGVEPGLVPLGAMGMGICLLVFVNKPAGFYMAGFWLFVAGVFSGLFLIPLQTNLQDRPERTHKGAVLGVTNVVSFTAVLSSAAIYTVLVGYGELSPQQVMGLLGGLTLVVGVGLVVCLPRFFTRFVLWLLVHTVYRINIRGENHIPREGPALLVANHVSYVDGLLISACLDRFVRFLAFKPLFRVPLLGSFLDWMNMIPVNPGKPGQVKRALRKARESLREGEVVCIFAEGQITRTGQVLGIRRGVERIGAEEDVPVIPIHLDEIWGSIFSYDKGRFFFKFPKKLPYPVTVRFGEPIKEPVTRTKVREAIQVLGTESAEERVAGRSTLPTQFIKTAHRSFWKMAMVDSLGPGPIRYGRLLVMSFAMARILRRKLPENTRNVGVLLPPSVPGAIVNLSLALLGKTSVNLNYTTGSDVMAHCVDQADIEHVVSSHKVLNRLDLDPPATILDIEELRDQITVRDRISALFWSLMPSKTSMNYFSGGQSIEDVVTIIFSSGSTGVPKGVKLSHGNILANLDALRQVGSIDGKDRVMAILPFFHSFGYTGGLWMPMVLGAGACYHHKPMDGKTIGTMMDRWEGSVLIGTPTFFRIYTRSCDKQQFSALRFPVCGAEKLKKPVAEAFHEKFDTWPLEGYGCTEMAPAVSVNLPDVRDNGTVIQRGRKLGSVGRPLPGVAIRIVDPETGQQLPDGQEGLILTRGPNRMQGYLDRPDKTREVFEGKWYKTGDIGKIDVEGFLHITDRLARFSKIGGEMVPHVKIEEHLQTIAEQRGQPDTEIAVTGVEDDRKGEKLLVLHTGEDVDPESWVEALRERELPKLWIPRANDFYPVDEIPKLGTGKLDIQSVKKQAKQLNNNT